MDIRNLILKLVKEHGKVKSSEIIKKTEFSRAYVNRFFQELCAEGALLRIGKANRTIYILAHKNSIQRQQIMSIEWSIDRFQNEQLEEDYVLSEIKRQTSIFPKLAKNLKDIVDYAFTEMLNNAIEHSQSQHIGISMKRSSDTISFEIRDNGIGIFRNIMQRNKLANELEAIHELLKGKQTTLPESHSGEGIFFTSKAADMLIINSFGKKLTFNGILDDIFIEDSKELKGTRVNFSIKLSSKKVLAKIFRTYTDDSYEFSKTKVLIKLYRMGTDYISRSQARRIVTGLDKFKTVVLDFKDIETVGQGFADEIFRVWQNKYPKIAIQALNTNENVQFMIDRAS